MVGTTVQPPEDLITVYSDTFQMKASTIRLDSVYAKSTNCLLGEMYDPVYGTVKADFICQFYCEEGFKFPRTPYGGRIDSVELLVFYEYASCFGDTLTPMQVTVYPIDKPLKKNFYTNDNPESYSDMNHPLGATSYTVRDLSVSDSIRNLDSYTPFIRVKMPVALGQKIYDETVNNPSSFDTQSSFNEFFPGVYITTTFGSGSIIMSQGENVSMRMFYNYAETDSEGQDSLVLAAQWFTVSKEVTQINRFSNSLLDDLLVENATHTYIKAPSGVCTRLVLPTKEISQNVDIQDRFINNFTLNLKYLPEEERSFAYTPPVHLLLLPEDSVKAFFEGGKIEDSRTSFLSFDGSSSSTSSLGYSSSGRTYYFGNISTLLKTHINNSPDKDLSLLV
ncbi:MAG: DUF4270 domain-containing protein, partial [Tannerella sp.]|nr:DUF4270 domain-containing protein [Tannerella sp.]